MKNIHLFVDVMGISLLHQLHFNGFVCLGQRIVRSFFVLFFLFFNSMIMLIIIPFFRRVPSFREM
jgi:hypothetical protein